jgi:hypothetical protein
MVCRGTLDAIDQEALMTRRRRLIIFLGCGVIVIAIGLTAIVLNREPSPVGTWSLGAPTEWIEFSDRKEEDLFTPSHDGTWIRHRGQDSTDGMWVRVPGDRHSFDMITHVSGPMWVKDGRLTLHGRSGEWKQGFSSDKVYNLTWRSADVPSFKDRPVPPANLHTEDVPSTSPVQF